MHTTTSSRPFERRRQLIRGGITTLLALALVGATMVAAFGSANVSAASSSGPNQVFFPQTGQYLGAPFLTYWRQNGGVMQFGYPISRQLNEHGLAVQYFQRAVLEYHPNNPARYQVELRLLGNEFTAGRQNEAPFKPIKAATDANCTFYAPTGHRLCFGFRDYWQNHGGLAQFGYPISEEFTENGLTVQYFQRARFEYHPNNPVRYQVLLGLLGSWAASQNHINTAPLPELTQVPVYSPNLWTPERCHVWQLEAAAGGGNAATGHRERIFTLTNTSDVTCTMYGYPGMQMQAANGQALPTYVHRGSDYFQFANVPPTTVTLNPGQMASFAIGYAVIPTGNEPCPTSNRLEITAPNDYDQLIIPFQMNPCGGRIDTSPVAFGYSW